MVRTASTCRRLQLCLSFDSTPYQFQRLGGKGNHICLAISSQLCITLTRYCPALARNSQCYITAGEWRQSIKDRNADRAPGRTYGVLFLVVPPVGPAVPLCNA